MPDFVVVLPGTMEPHPSFLCVVVDTKLRTANEHEMLATRDDCG